MKSNKRGRPVAKLESVQTTEIGGIIRTHRTLSGMSLKDMGKKLGLSLQYVSNIERGLQSLPLQAVTKLAVLTRNPAEKIALAAMMSRPSVAKFSEKVFVVGNK
jgi:transcriptional regulator with XRE-family HTH domain